MTPFNSDTAGDDFLQSNHGATTFVGGDMNNYAKGFRNVTATSTGGSDMANISDTAGNDEAWMFHGNTTLVGNNLKFVANGFQRVNLIARNGGDDIAHVYGTNNADTIFGNQSGTSMALASGRLLRSVGFETTNIDGRGGQDFGNLLGNVGFERFTADANQSRMEVGNHEINLTDVETTQFDGVDQIGEIIFADFSEGDLLLGDDEAVTGFINGNTIHARNIGMLEAQTESGSSSEYELGLVDYLFMLNGNWNRRS
ncbi:MAG: hypothetical protein R3C03_01855 [Pirellulaceae bacterium]